MTDRIEVQNVGRPGRTCRVDALKPAEMSAAMERVFPDSPPGLTPAEIIEAVRPNLSDTQFPGGETVGWRVKCVQLVFEAKGQVKRAPKAPVRLCRA